MSEFSPICIYLVISLLVSLILLGLILYLNDYRDLLLICMTIRRIVLIIATVRMGFSSVSSVSFCLDSLHSSSWELSSGEGAVGGNSGNWTSLLGSYSPGESSDSSVNQPPILPEQEPPLLNENVRGAELSDRLRFNWWGLAYNELALESVVDVQLQIEIRIEVALVEDGCDPQVFFDKRHQIRGFVFYPRGRALSEDAYAGYLAQIIHFGTRQSVPYQRIIQAIRNSDLFLW